MSHSVIFEKKRNEKKHDGNQMQAQYWYWFTKKKKKTREGNKKNYL